MEQAKVVIIPESIKLIKLTDEQYFSSTYKDYVSNSRLGLLNPAEGGSMQKYLEGFKGGPSESFELGSAVHGMILQPDEYYIADFKKPNGKLGTFANLAYKFQKEGLTLKEAIDKASIEADYYANKMSENRVKSALDSCLPYWEKLEQHELNLKNNPTNKECLILSEGMYPKFEACMKGLNENPKVNSTLYPQGVLNPAEFYNEYAIFVDVEVHTNGKIVPLKLKAKIDNFTINHETNELTLNDLKTTGKPVNYFMGCMANTSEGRKWIDGSWQKFHYYRQMGMYLFLLNAYNLSQGIQYKLRANMVVVETIPGFKSKVIPVNNKQIKDGLAEFKELLIILANGQDNNFECSSEFRKFEL